MPESTTVPAAAGDVTDVLAQLQALSDDWLGAAEQVVAGAQPAVTAVLLSNITPPIPLNGGGGGGFNQRLMGWIRPGIVGTLPLVGAVNVAPYGAPTPGVGTLVFYGVLALAGYGAFKLFKRG